MKSGFIYFSFCIIVCLPACSYFKPKAERDVMRLERQLAQTNRKLEQIYDHVAKILEVVKGHEVAIRNIELAIDMKRPTTAARPAVVPAPSVPSVVTEDPDRLYNGALAFFHRGDPFGARSLFSDFIQQFPNHEKANFAAAWIRYIDRSEGRADTVTPMEKTQRVPLQQRPATLAPAAKKPGHQELYGEALGAFQRQRYTEAISKFESFLFHYPDHDLADNSLYWIGESHYAMKDFHEAIKVFNSLIEKKPQGNKHPDATLKIAFSYLMLKNINGAREYFNRVIALYPTSPAANVARRRLPEIERQNVISPEGSEQLDSLQVYVKD